MPLGDGLLGVDVELFVFGSGLDFDPGCFRAEHQMRVFWRHWQRRVDGRGKRVDQLRPFRAEQP